MWTAESAASALREAGPDGWDALLGDVGFLCHVDPDLLKSVVPLTYRPRSAPAAELFEVYRTVARRLAGLDPGGRAQVLAVQAVRFGVDGGLGAGQGPGIWSCAWSSGDAAPRGLAVQFARTSTEKLALGSRDGRPVAVVSDSEDSTVWVWDLLHGLVVAGPLEGHEVLQEGCLRALVTVADGAIAVSSGYDRTVRCWDLMSGEQIGAELRFDGVDRAWSMAATRIGAAPAVVLGGSHALEVRGVAPDWKRLGEPMSQPDRVTAVATFELDGVPMAVAGCADGTVTMWDLAGCRQAGAPLRGHLGRITAIETTDLDGTTVVLTAGVDRTLRIWDARDQTPVGCHPVDGPGHISSLATIVRADGVGVLAAWNSGDLVSYFDLSRDDRAKPEAVELKPTIAAGSDVAAAEIDGRWVAVVAGGWSPKTGLWDVAVLTASDGGHPGGITALAVGRLGGVPALVTGGQDGVVRARDRATGAPLGPELTASPDRGIVDLAVTSFGGRDLAVTCDGRDAVRVWDLGAGSLLAELTTDCSWVRAVDITEIDGRPHIISAGAYHTQIWDVASTNERKTGLEHVSDYFDAVSATAVGGVPVALTAAPSGQVTVWDWLAAETHALPGHRLDVDCVATARIDGRTLALTTASHGSGGEVRVWDVGLRECLWASAASHFVVAAAIAGMGDRTVAFTGGEDGSVHVWDGATGHVLTVMHLPEAVSAMVWDGERLAVGYGSETAVFEIRLEPGDR